jgi:hypothetical protein
MSRAQPSTMISSVAPRRQFDFDAQTAQGSKP